MKPRLGFLAWIVSAIVLVGAIYAGVAILNFAWWGPGYPGSLAPERVRTAPRVSVYDRVIVMERDRVIFRHSTWAAARFAVLLGAAVVIVAIAVLVRMPLEEEDDARGWRDAIAEKIASRP